MSIIDDIERIFMKKRVEWIDIAKFLGIFAIYLGHFGENAGLAYSFVFSFHVPLFFFISGCMSNYDSERNLFRFIWKRFKGILLPFYCFAMVSIIIRVISNNLDLRAIKDLLILVAKGCIRNSFFAASLWFLSCLFIMEVVFKILKYVKFRTIILCVAGIFFWISEFLIVSRPTWAYNFDSMLYFFIFYAIGYCVYPYICNLFEANTNKKRIGIVLLFVISLLYMAFLYEGISICYKLSFNRFTNEIVQIVQPLIGIVFIFTLAKLLEGVKLINRIGMDTLYLCGNEYIIKTLFPMFFSIFGLSIIIDNPLKAYIYTFILIIVNFKIIIPIEKNIVGVIVEKLKKNS